MRKISVVIPTCNRAHFLQAAIQSVLNQTFQDFEIIIVDDASEDGTEQVIRSFDDSRIRSIRHESNRGQGATRNAGVRQASGEYVALLDDDDEWLPQKLEKQTVLLDKAPARVGLVYTGFWKIDAGTGRLIASAIPEKRGYVFNDMCADNWIGTCSTVLLRRRCFETTGLFDEGLTAGADYDMWLRISKEYDIEYIREPLVVYRVHGDRISTNCDSLIRGREELLRKHGSIFAMKPKNYSKLYLFLGVQYCNNNNVKKARESFLKAIKIYPFEIRHYFNLCLSLLGAKNFTKLKTVKEKWLAR